MNEIIEMYTTSCKLSKSQMATSLMFIQSTNALTDREKGTERNQGDDKIKLHTALQQLYM